MKVFYDSSIIIEGYKANPLAVELITNLAKISHQGFINSTVISEVTYILRKKDFLSIDQIQLKLSQFKILECNSEIISTAFEIMKNHDLKPNDAIILARCKYHKIDIVVSLDDDFKNPSKALNIKLNSLK